MVCLLACAQHISTSQMCNLYVSLPLILLFCFHRSVWRFGLYANFDAIFCAHTNLRFVTCAEHLCAYFKTIFSRFAFCLHSTAERMRDGVRLFVLMLDAFTIPHFFFCFFCLKFIGNVHNTNRVVCERQLYLASWMVS